MGSVGQSVYLWRMERRLTQKQLAGAAGISRPNLSDLERGKRELSLKSLRALASALGVTPGTLVDGVPPLALNGPLEFSREELDRIADAVFKGERSGGRVGEVAELLKVLSRSRICASGGTSGAASSSRSHASAQVKDKPRAGKRRVNAAWIHFKSALRQETAQALIQRIEDREITASG